MVRHWLKEQGTRWQVKLAINGFGAVTTALVTAVVVVTKFTQGAWVILIVVPALVVNFRWLHTHYAHEKTQIAHPQVPGPFNRPHRVLIPVAEITRAVEKNGELRAGVGERRHCDPCCNRSRSR